MTTPINTFEEILEALERDPVLKEALRRHILTDELLQMPSGSRESRQTSAPSRRISPPSQTL